MTKYLSAYIINAVKKGDTQAVRNFLKFHHHRPEKLNAMEKHIISTSIFKLGDTSGSSNDRLTHIAVRYDRLDILTDLVACAGINLNLMNRNFETPLTLAIQYHKTAAIKILLTSPSLNINQANQFSGLTPLMLAAQIGDIEIVKLLLAHGADTTLQNTTKYTAAEEAVAFGHTEIAKLIQSHQPPAIALSMR